MFASTAKTPTTRWLVTAMVALASIALVLTATFGLVRQAAATDNEGGGQGEEEGGDDGAGLNILKFIEGTTTRLPGAVFEIEGMDGTFTTDENGQICILGLPANTEWLVREIQAPEGYEIIEAEQMVKVDDDGSGLCDSPDARFYNRPVEESGTLEIRKATTPESSEAEFAFEASYGDPAAFSLSDGGTTEATELPVGDYSVWEVLAEMPENWSLTAITCSEDAGTLIDLQNAKVTVTIDDGDEIVCTFTNTLASGGGEPNQGPRGGTAGGNPPLPNTAMDQLSGSLPAVLLAALMLAGLGAGAWVTAAEVRRRR